MEEVLEYLNAIRLIADASSEESMQTIRMLAIKAHNELYDLKEEADDTRID
jgi:hypothetical protein